MGGPSSLAGIRQSRRRVDYGQRTERVPDRGGVAACPGPPADVGFRNCVLWCVHMLRRAAHWGHEVCPRITHASMAVVGSRCRRYSAEALATSGEVCRGHPRPIPIEQALRRLRPDAGRSPEELVLDDADRAAPTGVAAAARPRGRLRRFPRAGPVRARTMRHPCVCWSRITHSTDRRTRRPTASNWQGGPCARMRRVDLSTDWTTGRRPTADGL